VNRRVGVAGEHLTGDETAAALSKALAREVVYRAVEPDAFRAAGFPGAVELGNMFQFKRDFNDDFRRPRDVAFTRELNPRLKTFAEWLAENAARLPLEETAGAR